MENHKGQSYSKVWPLSHLTLQPFDPLLHKNCLCAFGITEGNNMLLFQVLVSLPENRLCNCNLNFFCKDTKLLISRAPMYFLLH